MDRDESGRDRHRRLFAAEVSLRSDKYHDSHGAGGQAPAAATSILASLRLSNADSRTCPAGEAGDCGAGDGLRGAFPEGSLSGSPMHAPDRTKPAGAGNNAHFVGFCPRADAMLRPAMAAYKEKRFEDTAYFEPFYLKQFVATVSAKKLF